MVCNSLVFSDIVTLPLGILEIASESSRRHVLLVNAPAHALRLQEVHDRLGGAGEVVYTVVGDAERGASSCGDVVGLAYKLVWWIQVLVWRGHKLTWDG